MCIAFESSAIYTAEYISMPRLYMQTWKTAKRPQDNDNSYSSKLTYRQQTNDCTKDSTLPPRHSRSQSDITWMSRLASFSLDVIRSLRPRMPGKLPKSVHTSRVGVRNRRRSLIGYRFVDSRGVLTIDTRLLWSLLCSLTYISMSCMRKSGLLI